jgi:hypothetical protein
VGLQLARLFAREQKNLNCEKLLLIMNSEFQRRILWGFEDARNCEDSSRRQHMRQ